ncbi:hypothetical protein CYMTET_8268, partial [Cymbomonas tetramitiformis]
MLPLLRFRLFFLSGLFFLELFTCHSSALGLTRIWLKPFENDESSEHFAEKAVWHSHGDGTSGSCLPTEENDAS